MASTGCAPVEPSGTSFETLERELDELARLIEDGRDLEHLRIERMIELGQLAADAGEDDRAHGTWDEVIALVDGRNDWEALRLASIAWTRHAGAFERHAERDRAVDCSTRSFEVARSAYKQWTTNGEIAEHLVGVALSLGMRNWELGRHELAIRSYDTALAVCAMFRRNPWFVRFEAKLELNRANAMVSLKRMEPDIVEWFDRAIETYESLHDPQDRYGIASAWLGRGNARADDATARRDYETGIAVLEPMLPDREAAILIAKCCHNIALLFRNAPTEALPFQTRAVELMYDAIEHGAGANDEFDLMYYRLARADMLAKAGLLASAIDEAAEVLPSFEDAVARRNERDALARMYREALASWRHQLAKRTPAAYRTWSAPPAVRPDDARCVFCKRGRVQVGVLVAGGTVHTCDGCAAEALDRIAVQPPAKLFRRVKCAFCNERHDKVAVTNGVGICFDCATSCDEMFREASAAGKIPFRCVFCRRPRADVTKLISGPRVFICNHCAVAAASFLAAQPPAAARTTMCGFCGEERQRIVATADGVICDDCIGLCNEILDEEIGKSHPDLRCGFCGSERGEVERLVLGAETALCNGCFTKTRGFLDRHHPYDPLLGRRTGERALQLDICGWCTTREALMFVHGEQLVLCDACVDLAAQDFP